MSCVFLQIQGPVLRHITTRHREKNLKRKKDKGTELSRHCLSSHHHYCTQSHAYVEYSALKVRAAKKINLKMLKEKKSDHRNSL